MRWTQTRSAFLATGETGDENRTGTDRTVSNADHCKTSISMASLGRLHSGGTLGEF